MGVNYKAGEWMRKQNGDWIEIKRGYKPKRQQYSSINKGSTDLPNLGKYDKNIQIV